MFFKRVFSYLFPFIFAAGAACTILTTNTLAALTRKELEMNYQNSLKKEEQELKTNLFTLVDIEDQNEWQEIKNNLQSDYKELCSDELEITTPLPAKLANPIVDLLKEKKIRTMLNIKNVVRDPGDLKITAFKKNGQTITFSCDESLGADAATNQFNVFFDPELVLETHANTAEIKATVAHELIHIANEDVFDTYCIERLYRERRKKIKVPRKKYRKAKGKWERFHEKRADLLSGLIEPEYAQAHEQHFKRNMPTKECFKSTSTHPTDRQRYGYVKKLVNDLHNTIPEKNYTLPIFIFLILLLLIFAHLAVRIKNCKSK